ncbi:MAG TPA: tRNA (adenosine(37)-N6)-dimethylallyltransferase MiaA [Patescibacteria group bacterium]|nr:tRNA (adenosine(37)-N6)-dimethylallyltransferase MiaA [Patescibacteria group bacterium]
MVAKKIELLAVIGPTASGKTALAINIAKKFDGEIIAADSRTVYKYLDIGTAKPTRKEQSGIPHWGLDLAGPGQTFTVADFKKYAEDMIEDIKNRGKLPILVGGSGLYVDAVIYNFKLAPANPKLRNKLSKLSIEQLQEKILKAGLAMPDNRLNKRYLIRAIERADTKIAKKPLANKTTIIGLNPFKDVLHDRIKARANLMLKADVLKEVKKAVELYGWESEAMTGGIYKAFRGVLLGEKSQEQGLADFIISDLHLAKKQMTWFKRNKDIIWFENLDSALDWFDRTFSGKL